MMRDVSRPEATPGAPGPVAEIVETADGSRTLHHAAAAQTYHSRHGALHEARHVFLEAGGVSARLARGEPARVLEIGLGTGLHLLLCADAAAASGATLHYRAIERMPPAADVLRALGYDRHLARPDLNEAWIRARASLDDGPGAPRPWRLPAGTLAPTVSVEVALGEAFTEEGTFSDAADALLEPGWADAVFHDAFSPGANPEAWRPPVLGRLAATLAPGGALVSYTVAGPVRRALAAHGLEVHKRPGPPGGKRHTLLARAPGRPARP